MKKTIIAAAVVIFVLPAALFAANMSFISGSSYHPGQIFSVQVMVNPQSAKVYTVKAEIAYPADILEVESFSFANGWIPLSQPGYDSVDNAGGTLIKTGGYPGGLSSVQALGIITFKAKKAGSASIAFRSGSLALDAANSNLLASSMPVSVFSIVEQEQKKIVAGDTPKILPVAGVKPAPVKVTGSLRIAPPLSPYLLAMLSIVAFINPVVALLVAAILLVSILFLKEEHRNRKIALRKKK